MSTLGTTASCPNHRSREYGGHTVFYDDAGRRANPENPQGRRASPEHLQFDQTDSEVSVVVMGDSFVEALQVAHEESFVGRLQNAASPNVSVENYGTSSYSPALYLLQWRTRIRDRAPTHVFLMLFGNDIRNDEEMTAIAELDTSGDIVTLWSAEPRQVRYPRRRPVGAGGPIDGDPEDRKRRRRDDAPVRLAEWLNPTGERKVHSLDLPSLYPRQPCESGMRENRTYRLSGGRRRALRWAPPPTRQ